LTFTKSGILVLNVEKIYLSTQTSMYIARRTSNVPYKQNKKKKLGNLDDYKWISRNSQGMPCDIKSLRLD